MKINCSKESLLKVILTAENVISTKNSISILSNILIEAYNNKLKISACETKLKFFADIGADVMEEGSISVHCNKFYSIAKKLPENELYLGTDKNNTLIIKPKNNDNIIYKIKGLDSSKFPAIKKKDDFNFFSINQEIISNMIKKTIFAISENESRKFVSGVFLEKSDKLIKMIATDGKRLSLIKNEINIPGNLEKGIIIPPKILIETLKLCTDIGDIQLAIDNKEIYIKIKNFSFISNLLEGNFPPYEKVIPNDNEISFCVNRKLLYDSLDRISQISDKESHKITFSISNNKILIHTEDIIIGSGEEIIPINYSGNEFKIALNSIYIIDVLNVLKEDEVIFELKDSQTTIVIKEKGNNDFIYIMMPLTT